MVENKLADLSMNFAVKILKMTDGIKGHYSLVNQSERRHRTFSGVLCYFVSRG